MGARGTTGYLQLLAGVGARQNQEKPLIEQENLLVFQPEPVPHPKVPQNSLSALNLATLVTIWLRESYLNYSLYLG
jgi:hypothetical protein